MSDIMTFPDTWEEFEKIYGFDDREEVYTNGSRLIQSFRVEQWLDHEENRRETKRQAINCTDCIKNGGDWECDRVHCHKGSLPSVHSKFEKNSKELDLIHLQKEQAYMQVYEDGKKVIRCKDCKWCSEHYDTDGNVPYWVCINWDAGTDADGFCHEAELRGDIDEGSNQQTSSN